MMAGTISEFRELVGFKQSILTGIAAAVLSFFGTLILSLIGRSSEFRTDMREGDFGTWEFTSQILLNAHFVDIGADVADGSYNWLSSPLSDWVFSIPTILFRIIPVVVLFLMARRLIQSREQAITTQADAMKVGASMALGYLPAIFFFASTGVHVVEGPFGAEDHVGPDIPETIILAGILYPVAIGALAGYHWYTTQDQD